MVLALYLVPVLFVAVLLLIRAELYHNRRQVFIFKPISTLLVIIMAALSFLAPTCNWTYTIIILVGLIFSFGGDVALIFQDNPKAFRIGLILFLLGHIAYTIAFILFSSFLGRDFISTLVLLTAAIGFYQLIKANLGAMKIPVILYIVIISIMLSRAIAILSSPSFEFTQSLMIFMGAFLFYISDIILAANRFWKPWRFSRVNLAFYFAGQMLIALSASYIFK